MRWHQSSRIPPCILLYSCSSIRLCSQLSPGVYLILLFRSPWPCLSVPTLVLLTGVVGLQAQLLAILFAPSFCAKVLTQMLA